LYDFLGLFFLQSVITPCGKVVSVHTLPCLGSVHKTKLKVIL